MTSLPAAEGPGAAGPTDPAALELAGSRLADRLRVLGPRWAARSVAADVELLAATRGCLQQLADLAADVEGRVRRPVPELAPAALADQVEVLVHDVAATRDAAAAGAAGRAVRELARRL